MTFIRPDPYGASTLCVLFADVAGSTQIFEALGDIEASGVMRNCMKIINAAAESQEGRAIQPLGDGLLTAFPTPEAAAEAAEDMMRRIHCEPRVAGRHLALRVGFHHGPVIVRTSNIFGGQLNIFGDTVNTAARIAALAKPRQILTSRTTLDMLPARWQQAARVLDAFTLKGKRENVQICDLVWQNPDNTLLARMFDDAREVSLGPATLRYHQQEFVLDERFKGLSLGRELNNDIVFEDKRISRHHARVERRRDKILLIDKSTNGTYVCFEGMREFSLHMEESILFGKGSISLGCPGPANDPAGILEFEVF